MASSVTELLDLIITKILSGGRRTTADNTRQVLSEISQSTLNKVDGGVVEGPVELQGDLIIPDDEEQYRWKIKITSQGQVYGEKI